jgi:methylenetetrahydrofolate reductase (NADPH)
MVTDATSLAAFNRAAHASDELAAPDYPGARAVVNTFQSALNTRDFVITSEILLGAGSGVDHVNEQAGLLRDAVDGVLVTDNQSGRLHMSSLAASRLLLDAGIDPIMQLGCRNRNRVALLGDLLGAGALGVRNLQLVRGEMVPIGFVPRPKAMLDVTATELIGLTEKMRLEEGIGRFPDLFLGGVVTPRIPKPDWPARKVVEKVEAGARFLMTHTCMNIDVIRQYMKHLVALKMTHRASVLVSLPVLASAQDALWMRANKANVIIPEAIVERLNRHARPRAEGIAIAAELLRHCAEIPGVAGVHLYAPTDLRSVPETLEMAGIAGRCESE